MFDFIKIQVQALKDMANDKKLFDSINWKQGDNIKFYAVSKLSVMKIVQDDIVKAVVMPVKMKG